MWGESADIPSRLTHAEIADADIPYIRIIIYKTDEPRGFRDMLKLRMHCNNYFLWKMCAAKICFIDNLSHHQGGTPLIP